MFNRMFPPRDSVQSHGFHQGFTFNRMVSVKVSRSDARLPSRLHVQSLGFRQGIAFSRTASIKASRSIAWFPSRFRVQTQTVSVKISLPFGRFF
jgi:hypothetical protein